MSFKPTRRAVVGGLAASSAINFKAFGQNLTMPSSPVTPARSVTKVISERQEPFAA